MLLEKAWIHFLILSQGELLGRQSSWSLIEKEISEIKPATLGKKTESYLVLDDTVVEI